MQNTQEIVLSDEAFLVSETDEKGILLYANKDFCDISGYEMNEFVGHNHRMFKNSSMPKEVFESLWSTLQSGNTWAGFIKNNTKSGQYYWSYATMYPTTTTCGKKGYICCRRRATSEEIKEYETMYTQGNFKY
jgi:aerotaxis receptor